MNVSGVLGERMAARLTGLGWHGFAHKRGLYQQRKRQCRGLSSGTVMKIKIASWADYDFDKEDAKIAVPLILLLQQSQLQCFSNDRNDTIVVRRDFILERVLQCVTQRS